MSTSRSPISPLRKLAFAATASVFVLGTLELGLALTEPLWADDAHEAVPLTRKEQDRASRVLLGAQDQRGMADTLRFHVRSNVLTQHDPELLFRVAPNPTGEAIHQYSGINAQGFRGRSLNAPPPGARSILLLGDSCGFGWGLHEYPETIGGRLEQIYAQAGSELTPRAVFNLSQPGYSSEQARMLFERWHMALQPDLVILYLGWNDLYLSGSEDRDTLRRLRIANASGLRLIRSTHLFRALEQVLRHTPGTAPNEADEARKRGIRRVSQQRSVENLRSIVEAVRGRGGYVVIIPPPSLAFMRSSGMPDYIASLRESLSDNALFLELPEMDVAASGRESYFIRDGFHPNERGAAHIAQQIVRADLALERLDVPEAAP
ncbi:MAG: SGNH/GDSL hydrolase family protein [Myxococcota bacterium]|nr:SGNH/GDSL hydrolase family protein [Myxococcota bacterium]